MTEAPQWMDNCERGWEMTSIPGRIEILRKVMGIVNEPLDWRFQVGQVAKTESFVDLPASLQGYLMAAYTDDGWDFKTLDLVMSILGDKSGSSPK